jgi:hypothetical protein
MYLLGVGLLYGVPVLALAMIVATCVLLFVGPRWLVAWFIVATYVSWPALWPVAKEVLFARSGFYLPYQVGTVFPDPELLGGNPSGGRLNALTTRVARWLAWFIEIGLWPAAGLTRRTLHTVTTGSARLRSPRLTTYAVMSALCAIALIGIRAWTGNSIAVTVAALGLLATITARHLLWILSGANFRLLLKRSMPDPYVALVVLAVFDYIALVAIAVVLRWEPGDHVSLATAVAEGRYLLELRHLTKLLQLTGLSPVLVCLALASAAYWASLASQVFRFTSFRRDYDDRAWLAALTLREGSIEDASRLFAPVPREHVSGPVNQMRIRLALARSDLAAARPLARALYDQLDPEHATEDGAIVYLAKQMSLAPVEPDEAWGVVRQACAAGISDGAMFVALWHMRNSGIAGQDDRKARARASGLTPESYPMGWLLGSAQSAEAAERVLERARPANDTDAAVREAARQVAREERRFLPSPEKTGKDLAEMLAALPGLPLEDFPWWLRDFLVRITWRLDRRGHRYGLPRAKELRAVRRRLLAMPMPAAEAVLKDFDITERARGRASKTTLDQMLSFSYEGY